MNGKPTHIGLGAYPVITPAMARGKAIENARALTLGRDPRGELTEIPTFAKAAEIVIGIHAEGWKDGGKSENQWRSSLRDYVLPKIGHKRVNDITTADVMSVLVPHWMGKHETMRRVKQRVSAVMRWSMAQGYRQDDPAGGSGYGEEVNLSVFPYDNSGELLIVLQRTLSHCVGRNVSHFEFDSLFWQVAASRIGGH